MTDEARDRWIETSLSHPIYEQRPDAAARARRRYLEAPLPATMPVHAELVVDADDRLWVERYAPPWESASEWWVFEADGGPVGRVVLPAGLEVFEIGSDYVLGLRRDELDVESVELYELTRAP